LDRASVYGTEGCRFDSCKLQSASAPFQIEKYSASIEAFAPEISCFEPPWSTPIQRQLFLLLLTIAHLICLGVRRTLS
jgi:hypothetical protein